MQTPQYRMNSLEALLRTPIGAPFRRREHARRRPRWPARPTPATRSSGAGPEPGVGRLRQSRARRRAGRNCSPISRASAAASRPAIVNHYNVQPVFDVYANLDRRDLGSVGAEVEKIVSEMTPSCRAARRIEVRGQYHHHAELVLPPGPGHDLRGGAGLPADGGQFPVAGSTRSSS